MPKEGRNGFLRERLARSHRWPIRLPQAAVEAHPRALAHRAEVARLRGEYEFAHSMLRRAVTLLHEREDNEGEADALHSLATLARRDGDYELAFTYLDRATVLTEPNSAVRTKCGNTRGLCLVAMGEWTAAEREFRAALAVGRRTKRRTLHSADRAQPGDAGGHARRFRRGVALAEPHVAKRRRH